MQRWSSDETLSHPDSLVRGNHDNTLVARSWRCRRRDSQSSSSQTSWAGRTSGSPEADHQKLIRFIKTFIMCVTMRMGRMKKMRIRPFVWTLSGIEQPRCCRFRSSSTTEEETRRKSNQIQKRGTGWNRSWTSLACELTLASLSDIHWPEQFK